MLCSALVDIYNWILVASSLGPNAFGSFAFVQWLTLIPLPVIGIGMSARSYSQLADIQRHEPPRFASGIFYFLWYRQCRYICFYCLAYLLLLLPFSWLFPFCSPLLVGLALLSCLSLFFSSVVGIALRSQECIDLLALLRLFSSLLTLLLFFVAAQLHMAEVSLFLLALAITNVLTLAMALLCLTRLLPLQLALKPGFYLRERLHRSLHGSLQHFLLDAVVWQHGELLLLAFWRSPSELAFYTVSILVSKSVMRIAPFIVLGPLLPWFLRSLPHDSPYDAFVRTSCSIALLSMCVCLLAMASSPFLLSLSLGSAYQPVVLPLRILLISTAFGSVATVSLTYLASQRYRSPQFRLGIGCTLLTMLLALPLVPLWGMTGAALASATSQAISALGSIFLCRKLLSRHSLYELS